jgi:hypothetical protein
MRLESEQQKLLLERLRAGDLNRLHDELDVSTQMINELKRDFWLPMAAENGSTILPHQRRSAVRAFGSLIDSFAACMRMAAVELCRLFDHPLNIFLEQKSEDRQLCVHYRMHSLYRLLANFLPHSPFAHVPDHRWNHLRRALEIRNRVTHPEAPADLEVNDAELRLLINLAAEFDADLRKFVHWFGQAEQKLLWEIPMPRKRFAPKIGRNDPCPCGSTLQYKKCCLGAQQWNAAAA